VSSSGCFRPPPQTRSVLLLLGRGLGLLLHAVHAALRGPSPTLLATAHHLRLLTTNLGLHFGHAAGANSVDIVAHGCGFFLISIVSASAYSWSFAENDMYS
jgi:hypothetical protein